MKTADKNYFFIILTGLLMYVPFLGHVHLFDWDEINFAEAAREMLTTGNYLQVQINYMPFGEKPPLFIWLQALSMNIFGVNEFAARFPNAIVGVITLLFIYMVGKKLFDKRLGLWWVLAYAGSILPQLYFKSGIIDPTFNLLIVCSVYFLCRFILAKQNEQSGVKWISLSAIFLGLAVLTKGPAAVLIMGLCWLVFVIVEWRRTKHIWYNEYLLFIPLVIVVSGSWFLLIGVVKGWDSLTWFLQYQVRLMTTQDAGHGGPIYYHPVVLLAGCFPASAAVFMARKNKTDETEGQRHFRLWMIILFTVTLVVFSLVKTKIVHYSSLCYFPLTFLAAYILWQKEENLMGKKVTIIVLAFIGFILSVVLTALPFIGSNLRHFIPYVKDKFAQGNMEANVHWSAWLALIGLTLFLFSLRGIILMFKGKVNRAFIILFMGSIITVQLTLFFIVPRIEQYSQNSAIEFYRSKANEDCYVGVYGFKSYAYLFYPKKSPELNPNHADIEWLLRGPVDKPVYIVGKNTSDQELSNYDSLEKIGEKNGFVFYRRKALYITPE